MGLKMNQLNASIVLYQKEKEPLLNVIKSFLSASSAVKLYLVDNSSNNDLEGLSTLDSRIEYIFNCANLGYGSAHNIALKQSVQKKVKYHLVLNPDIDFEVGTLEKLIDFMETNQDVGIVMPNISYPDGSIQYLCKLLPTPFISFFRRFCTIKNIKNKIDYKYEMRFSGYNQVMNVPALSGCFMLIRTKVIEEIGGFDERFFMYAEDLDFSRRVHKKYKTVFYPHVTVIHGYEKGSYSNYKLLRYHMASLFKYYCKWGWIFDRDRKNINNIAINQFNR